MFDLRAHVVDLLAKYNKAISQQFNAIYPVEPELDSLQQLQHLEMFWRIQLGRIENDTVEARLWLETDVPIDVWLQRFEQHVVPVILRFSLPKP